MHVYVCFTYVLYLQDKNVTDHRTAVFLFCEAVCVPLLVILANKTELFILNSCKCMHVIHHKGWQEYHIAEGRGEGPNEAETIN